MSDTVWTEKMGHFTVRLEQDTNTQSPAEWQDESAFLCAWHDRVFYVAPPGIKGRFDAQAVVEQYKDTHHIFFIEAYIHSGVVLALTGEGNFPDRPWDVSGNIGAIFLAREEWKRRDKKARTYALAQVEAWNQYLNGGVYGYIVEDAGGETLNSCWGFYGFEYAKGEALNALRYQVAECDKIPTLKAIGV